MIYVYEIVTKPLTSKIISDEICPVCNKNGCIELTLYMRYISMVIPFFGMGRKTGVVCTNCGEVLKNPDASVFAKKKYSANIEAEINQIRNNHKRTLWQLSYPWSFCIVLPLIVLIALGYSKINNKSIEKKSEEYAALIANPQSGDIYKSTWSQENSQLHGTLVKLIRIDADTMYVIRSKEMIPMSFSKAEWDKLSSNADAFDSKEYKVKKFTDLNGGNFGQFFLYNKDNNGKMTPKYLGAILDNNAAMDLNFETIVRAK